MATKKKEQVRTKKRETDSVHWGGRWGKHWLSAAITPLRKPCSHESLPAKWPTWYNAPRSLSQARTVWEDPSGFCSLTLIREPVPKRECALALRWGRIKSYSWKLSCRSGGGSHLSVTSKQHIGLTLDICFGWLTQGATVAGQWI